MPHAHILLSVHPEDAPNTPAKIDKVVWGRIPEEPTEDMTPEEVAFRRMLIKAVCKHNLHSKCKGVPEAYCNQGRKSYWKTCCKRFPKV